MLLKISIILLCVCAEVHARADDNDSDKDGLPDFQEVHKYLTDPHERESDGDGVPDGDWHERREYAYTIRSVVKVMRPCNTAIVDDDYQGERAPGTGGSGARAAGTGDHGAWGADRMKQDTVKC